MTGFRDRSVRTRCVTAEHGEAYNKPKGVVAMFVAGFIVGAVGAGVLCTLIATTKKK